MAIQVNDVVRVTYWQRLFQQRVLTVLHLRCITAPPPLEPEFTVLTNLAQTLANMNDPLIAAWRPLVTADLLFDQVRCQKVFPTRTIYGQSAMLYTGTNAGTSQTANVAISIEKRSSVAGRTGIGRIQMAGVPAESMASGSFTPLYTTQVQTAWQELLETVTSPIDGAVYRTCLWGAGQVGASADLIDIQAKDTVRTMHRRTVRVGE